MPKIFSETVILFYLCGLGGTDIGQMYIGLQQIIILIMD